MSRKTRKYVAAIVCIFIMFGIFTSCKKTDESSSTTASTTTTRATTASTAATTTKAGETEPETTEHINSWEIDTSYVKLKLFADQPAAQFYQNWGVDDVSKKWVEETGVDIEWIIPPDASLTQLNLMIASDDLPDMLHTRKNTQQVIDLAKNGKLWPLNELAEQYAPDFIKQHYDRHIIVDLRMEFDSMDIYAIRAMHLREKYYDSPYTVGLMSGIFVIKNVYEELGSPVIKNTDDFIEMAKSVKSMYPELTIVQSGRAASPAGDGSPRIINSSLPIAGLNQKYFKDGNGVYYYYWEHENFIDLLKFVNNLHNEGLIDITAELTATAVVLRGKLWSGEVFADLNNDIDNVNRFNGEMQKVKPDWEWTVLEPFTINPDKMEYYGDSLGGGAGSLNNIITKASKHPERAIRFLDYVMQDDNQKELIFGLEGRGHNVIDGIPVMSPEYWAEAETVGQNLTLFGNFTNWAWREYYWRQLYAYTSADESIRGYFSTMNKYYKDLSFYSGADLYPQNSDEEKVAASVKDYYQTEVVEIIMARPDRVEEMYQNMINRMKSLGLDKLNQYWTNYFNNKDSVINKYSQDLN